MPPLMRHCCLWKFISNAETWGGHSWCRCITGVWTSNSGHESNIALSICAFYSKGLCLEKCGHGGVTVVGGYNTSCCVGSKGNCVFKKVCIRGTSIEYNLMKIIACLQLNGDVMHCSYFVINKSGISVLHFFSKSSLHIKARSNVFMQKLFCCLCNNKNNLRKQN